MSETKSRPYTITGVSFAEGSQAVFNFNPNGEIIGVSERLSNGNIKPVEPGTTDFDQATASAEALNAYNVNKYKTNKNAYETAITKASDEELSNRYVKQNKKFNNASFISSGGVATIAQYSSEYAGGEEENEYTDSEFGYMMDTRKLRGKIFAYPLDIDPEQDHLKITRYMYRRPDINQSKGVKSIEAGNPARSLFVAKERVKGSSVLSGEPAGSVLLPMPKATDVNAAAWGKGEINSTGLAAMGLAQGGLEGFLSAGSGLLTGKKMSDAFEDLKLKLKNGDGDITSGGTGAMMQAITIEGATKILSLIPGVQVDTDAYLARTDGRVLNPNAEMLFQGPSIRDFAFSFIMIARSQKEGQEIRKIIRFLKIAMAPKMRNSTFLKAPDVFMLEYKNGKGKDDVLKTANLFNPGGLALTTMNVDYAPNGYWSAYRDSQPVAVKMDLNFTELRPIYQSDQMDTPEDSVGM